MEIGDIVLLHVNVIMAKAIVTAIMIVKVVLIVELIMVSILDFHLFWIYV